MQRYVFWMAFFAILSIIGLSGCTSSGGPAPVLDIGDLLHAKTEKPSSKAAPREKSRIASRVSSNSSFRLSVSASPATLSVAHYSSGERLPVVIKKGWRWPTEGALLRVYSDGHKGILIGAPIGAPVRAAASGEVVYAGAGLKQYGRLILLKHTPFYFTAYGYNYSIRVREGERVSQGAIIGTVGAAPNKQAGLYFEIRRDEKAVDPIYFLTR